MIRSGRNGSNAGRDREPASSRLWGTLLRDFASLTKGDPFRSFMGLPVFMAWILFTALYAAAIYRRHRPADDKRFTLVTSASALGAATFRIVIQIFGFSPAAAIAGTAAPSLFIAGR